MKRDVIGKRIALFAMIVVVVTSICVGCTEKDDTATNEMIQMMPKTSEYVMIIDFKAAREEQGLQDLYSVVTEDSTAFLASTDSVDTMAVGSSSSEEFYFLLLRGRFGDQMPAVEEGCSSVETYNDTEILTNCQESAGDDARVIFSDEMIMRCKVGAQETVKMIVDIVKNGGTSAYEADQDIRDVVDRLPPERLITTIVRQGYGNTWQSLVAGFSITVHTAETAQFKIVLKYATQEDATTYKSNVLDDLKNQNVELSDLSTTQDSGIVEITGVLPMKDISKFIGFSS